MAKKLNPARAFRFMFLEGASVFEVDFVIMRADRWKRCERAKSGEWSTGQHGKYVYATRLTLPATQPRSIPTIPSIPHLLASSFGLN